MKFIILVFAAIMLCTACKKYAKEVDDTRQNGTLRGRLFLYDTLTGSYIDYLPVKSRAITAAYDTGGISNDFLYSVQTDTAGYFTFNNLLSNRPYRLHYQETINGIVYTADDTLLEGNTNFAMYSGISKTLNNGIYYIFTDAQGGRVPGVNVCVFTSSVLAVPDTCAGSSFSLPPSDAYGRTWKFDLKPGTYYTFITVNYPGFVVKKHDQLTVPVAGFQTRFFTLP